MRIKLLPDEVSMAEKTKKILSGNEAIALAALHAGCAYGVGYPGTPSTEILERFSELGGDAEWAPNEKVAAETALGVAFAGSSALVTMKHVGFNVAQDLFFTAAYSGIEGSYVAVVADDPGMASSQNEQDTRPLALAGGLPVLEPSDSQEAYDFAKLAFSLSRRWKIPFILRTTTRIAHSSTVVSFEDSRAPKPQADYNRDISTRVMVPAFARPAHRVLRKKLAEMRRWNDSEGPNVEIDGADDSLLIVADGVCYYHAREAFPDAGFFKVGMVNPLPVGRIALMASKYKRCVVVEEGDPFIATQLRAAGLKVEERDEKWRFGEMSVDKARAQIEGNLDYEPAPIKAKPPQLCDGCPHRFSFAPMVELGCIVAGDIGCYTLAAMKPISGMDIQICMGASINIGLGLRKVLPPDKARKVVSVIGDSTFMHSGLTGLLQMVYNLPDTGHVVVVVDNSTTAMTGQQEHPGTGRKLDHVTPAHKVSIEKVAEAIGVKNVAVFNPVREGEKFKQYLREKLETNDSTVIVLRQPCLLAAANLAKLKRGV